MTSKAVAIAAGGGGDAITAAIVAEKLQPRFDVVAIMSYSWDRLIIDPTPGPRGRADFEGLVEHSPLIAEITGSTRLRTAGRSTLPGLVSHLPYPMLLIDPLAGAVGLTAQFRSAAELFGADMLIVVDVGGDILAEGHEVGLRSPLADSLVLAAAVQSDLPVHLMITGLGLDGELTMVELHALLDRHRSVTVADLETLDVARFADVWSWHPSEASGLVSVAATGWRGMVETQRDALIEISDSSTAIFEVDATTVAMSSLAAELRDTTALIEAEQRIRARRGYSDIDIERDRLAARREPRMPGTDTLDDIDRYAAVAAVRGVDALTLRRVIELSGAAGAEAAEAIRELLLRARPHHVRPPLYLTRRSGRSQ